jgi:hypothetical protein
MSMCPADGLLQTAMWPAIQLHIMQLKECGGPQDADFERARKVSDVLGEKGDILLFGGGKKGEVASIFNETARAIAILAFCPGGIDIFGSHFDAKGV